MALQWQKQSWGKKGCDRDLGSAFLLCLETHSHENQQQNYVFTSQGLSRVITFYYAQLPKGPTYSPRESSFQHKNLCGNTQVISQLCNSHIQSESCSSLKRLLAIMKCSSFPRVLPPFHFIIWDIAFPPHSLRFSPL